MAFSRGSARSVQWKCSDCVPGDCSDSRNLGWSPRDGTFRRAGSLDIAVLREVELACVCPRIFFAWFEQSGQVSTQPPRTLEPRSGFSSTVVQVQTALSSRFLFASARLVQKSAQGRVFSTSLGENKANALFTLTKMRRRRLVRAATRSPELRSRRPIFQVVERSFRQIVSLSSWLQSGHRKMRISELPLAAGTIELRCISTLQRQSGDSVEPATSTRSNVDMTRLAVS
jgi:hypothetical protein